jgi:16S rRNA (guanine1207-N2)-methyltransferase
MRDLNQTRRGRQLIEHPKVMVYGAPVEGLAEAPPDAVQLSPLVPGSARLEDLAEGAADGVVIVAPPGTLERRYVLALALRALKPGAPLAAMAPKDKGGGRIGAELKAFGCTVTDTGKRHQRLCQTHRPDAPTGLDEAIAAGALRLDPALGEWTQPGLFSWDRPDSGTALLLSVLPRLTGAGADLGCGGGRIARAVLAKPGVTSLDLIDLDRRAIDAARRNVEDPRARFHWADARTAPLPEKLDFVVMNPPFHDGGQEDRSLGQDFIRRSHALLRKGGEAWLVANRHLPYEPVLTPLFTRVELKADSGGFKVYQGRK